MTRLTPLRAVARGLAAGAIGTAVMTAWQELSMRLQSDDDGDPDGDAPPDPWEQAPAPAHVARRILEGVFDREVPPERIGLLTNVTHWGYGTTWGAVYELIHGTRPGSELRRGLVFGTGVWAMSYALLTPMGLYRPPWEYPPRELAMDLSYHLAYGAGLGAGYAALRR